MNLDCFDWYCDECNALLNDQPGFSTNSGSWSCKECGEVNYMNENEILSDIEAEEFRNSGFDSYNEYNADKYSGEGLSVDDAAIIWLSHGKDEDYMFGYSEYELEDALR